jgi:flavin reductase (DIM6/NTAB) family NADH-FMN oxidoreductase RutF
MVIGRVLGIHIDDRYINDGRVDTAAMRPIARLGYSEYATVTEAWRMRRPA